MGGNVAVGGGVGERSGVAVGATTRVGVGERVAVGVAVAVLGSKAAGSVICHGFQLQRMASRPIRIRGHRRAPREIGGFLARCSLS